MLKLLPGTPGCAILVLLMVGGMALSCQKDVPELALSPGTVSTQRAENVSGTEGEEELSAKMPLPAHAQKKGPIIVGGCRESCEDPKNSFRSFIRALFKTGAEDSPPVARFIDTSTLEDNGEELGRRWADMWVMKRHEKRQSEIDSWLASYVERVGVVSSIVAVEEALESGLRFRRISSTSVEFTFIPPQRKESRNSEEWRVILGQRGLEWLVQVIYD